MSVRNWRLWRTTWVPAVIAAAACAVLGVGVAPAVAAPAGAEGAGAVGTMVMHPDGGCVLTICGEVYNDQAVGLYVTMNWCCTDNRYLDGYEDTVGWGDVDGLQIPSGCEGKVEIENFPQGAYQTYLWGSGWHRIHTNQRAFVLQMPCGD
jgi:hypothetical protein